MPDHDVLGPPLPARVALMAPVIGWATGVVLAAVGTALIDALVGADGTVAAAAGLSLLSIGFLIGALAVVRHRVRIEPADIGLAPVGPSALFAWAAVAGVPALAVAAAGFAGQPIAPALPAPAVLGSPGAEIAFGAPAPIVAFDVGVVAVALALVVLPAIAAELVIRGIVLRSLARATGVLPAVAAAALLTPAPFALLCGGELPTPVAAAALLGGVCLSHAYLRTGSAYPGIATLAAGLGLVYGLSLGWSLAAAAALAVAGAALAVTLAAWLGSTWSASGRRSPYGARVARAWG